MKLRRLSVFPVLAVSALGLAACQPAIPDSGAGVGFGDYNSYIRNAQNTAQVAPPVAAPVAPPVAAAPVFNPSMATAAIDRASGVVPAAPSAAIQAAPQSLQSTAPGAPLSALSPAIAPAQVAAPAAPVGALAADRPRGDAPMGIQVQSGEVINPSISDENDFNAVAARETIESDAQRIAQNRSQYVVVQPKDLPQRPGDTGPNIVGFALATTHAPGVQMYERGSLFQKDPLKACAKFASPDIAQQEFLSRGGPDRDRLGLDPDGDGFACGWDPRPFRTALN